MVAPAPGVAVRLRVPAGSATLPLLASAGPPSPTLRCIPVRLPSRLVHLAEAQHGLLARWQLVEGGASVAAIDHALQRGHLRHAARGVYRLPGAPVIWPQRVLAACLAGGPLAVSSHRTAGASHGLGVTPRRIELLTPRWQRTHRERGVCVHEAKDLRAIDVTSVDGIPTTSAVRTVLDLASTLERRELTAVTDQVVREGLATEDQLVDRFQQTRRRGKRGYVLLGEVIEEVVGRPVGSASRFEDLAVELVLDLGLPMPVLQHPVEIAGTTVYLDMAWPELELLIECDSLAYHRDVHAFRWDRRRQNALVLLGWTVLRLSFDDVVRRRAATGSTILAAYERQVAALGGRNFTL